MRGLRLVEAPGHGQNPQGNTAEAFCGFVVYISVLRVMFLKKVPSQTLIEMSSFRFSKEVQKQIRIAAFPAVPNCVCTSLVTDRYLGQWTAIKIWDPGYRRT